MSSEKESNVQSSGIGFFGLLGIIFITLKLLGITVVSTWSWWVVLLPIYGGIALVLGIFLFTVMIAGIIGVFSK